LGPLKPFSGFLIYRNPPLPKIKVEKRGVTAADAQTGLTRIFFEF
jgi:hypothetical protein